MHHPEIANIVRILDDYFLISAPNTSSSIKGIKASWGNEDTVAISRQLTNGKLEIQIKGEDEDDNDIDIFYYSQEGEDQFQKRLQISNDDFSLQNIRKAIRDIVIYDLIPIANNGKENSIENWLKD